MLRCLFGLLHKYEAVSVCHYYDVSYNDKAPSTTVTLRCNKCGKVITKSLYNSGHIQLEELQDK